MKKIFFKLRGKAVPVLLSIALILTGMLSIGSIKNIQGDARVINYTGIVRGATQRLIKKELNHQPDDELIKKLDRILDGLSEGSSELRLIRLNSQEYQILLSEMKEQWSEIKTEIVRFRGGEAGDQLFEMSESYFNLADLTVLAAEVYTEKSVQRAREILLYMNLVFIVLAGLSALSAFYQEKRRRNLREAEEKNKKKSEQLTKLFQALLVPMNEVSELLYISDINTYELLFVNNAGKETFHTDEKKGMKCYQVLQGFDAPCPFCTNDCISKDENYTWEYTNPLTKRHYLLKDRLIEWDGRPARMEIAFDITETANEKIELQRRLDNDKILVECIRELHRNHDTEAAANYVLEQIGRLFLADRAYIFIFHENSFTNTAEWCKEGIRPEIGNLQNIPQAEFSVWIEMFRHQENVVIDNLENLKENMSEAYEFMKVQGIGCVVMVPLERDGRLSGCIGLDNPTKILLESAVSLLQTLRYFLMLAMRRNEDEKALYTLSYQDTLTSFYNRNRFIQDIESLTGSGHSVGVVYLDVNGLKEINDHFGHAAGDQVLRECAETMQRTFQTASLYRIGGDEFVIICTDISADSFNGLVDQLRSSFQDNKCQAAIGTRWEETCKNIQSVISEADEIMYEDKKAFYHNHQPSGRYRRTTDAFHYLTDPVVLREKIAQERFLVYLQPKADAESRRITGAEALVRYLDEDGVIQPPDKFIPTLEDSGLIGLVDLFVFEFVCRTIKDWKNRGKELIPISCNFSLGTFIEPSFAVCLEDICSKYEVPREYLEAEMIGGMGSEDYKNMSMQIDRVKKAGFQVSADNFGLKCSNLPLLSMTAFDALKIDRELVKEIIPNPNTGIIIEAMADACRKMNIRLIAEGVEEEEQLEILRKCGIKTVQGFLFSQPVPVEEFEKKYFL